MDRQQAIEQINEQIDIVSLVGEFVPLEKSGKGYKGLCPFHSEKTPSFHVNPEKKIAYCFGCHSGGSAIKFYSQIKNISTDDAIKELGERIGIHYTPNQNINRTPEEQRFFSCLRQSADFYAYYLNHSQLGQSAFKYLESRNIQPEFIEKYQIGLSPEEPASLYQVLKTNGFDESISEAVGLIRKSDKGMWFDTFRGRIMFPILNEYGEPIGFSGRIFKDSQRDEPKYLNSNENLLFKKRNVLYHLYDAKKSIKDLGYAIITEGFMDVMAYDMSGLGNAICTMGTAFTKEHATMLQKYTSRVVLCYDGDSAGQAATQKTVPILLEAGFQVSVLTLPENKDPDEYGRAYGYDTLKKYFLENQMDSYQFQYMLLKNSIQFYSLNEIEDLKRQLFLLIRDKGPIVIEKMLRQFSTDFEVTFDSLQADFYNKKIIKETQKNTHQRIIKNEIKDEKCLNQYDLAERIVLSYMLISKRYAMLVNQKNLDAISDKNLDIKLQLISYYRDHTEIMDENNPEDFYNTLSEELKDYYDAKISIPKEFNSNQARDYLDALTDFEKELRIKEISKEMKRSNLSEEEKIKLAQEKIALKKELESNRKKRGGNNGIY